MALSNVFFAYTPYPQPDEADCLGTIPSDMLLQESSCGQHAVDDVRSIDRSKGRAGLTSTKDERRR